MSELDTQSSKELFERGRVAIEELTNFSVKLQAGFDYTANLKITKNISPKPLKGLTFPKDFKYKTLVDASDLSDLTSIFTDFSDEVEDEEVVAFWRPLIKPKGTTNSNALIAYTSMLLRAESENKERYGAGKIIKNNSSLYPDQLPKGVVPESFLPERSWFDPKMREIALKDIFTIMPDAEREILAICLGRALVGPSGNLHLESDEPIKHTFRTLPLIYGQDPGQGKSHIFEQFLIPALKHVGFAVAIFVTLHEKYGLGKVAGSDMAYKDDLSSEELIANLKGKHVKTLITGGSLRVEDKYIASYTATATTMVMANINEFDLNRVSQLDEGILSRLEILKTKSNTELDQWVGEGASEGSPDPKQDLHIPFLCEKYDIDEMTLALWALRLCADKFMDILERSRETSKNVLADTVKALSKNLRIQINHSLMSKNTCILLQFASRLRGHTEPMGPISINNLQTSLNDAAYLAIANGLKPVREKLKEDWLAKKKPDSHPWVALNHIRTPSLVNAIEKLGDLTKGSNGKDLSEAIKAMFGAITTTSGFKISFSNVRVTAAWNDSKRVVQSLDPLIEDIVSNCEESVVEHLLVENVTPTIQLDIQDKI